MTASSPPGHLLSSAEMQARVEAFFDAARFAQQVLCTDAVADTWEHDSVLPRLTVSGLAGHLFLALRVTERIIDSSPPPVDTVMLPIGEWYGRVRIAGEHDLDASQHQTIRRDGRHVGGRGWSNVVERYERLLARLAALVGDISTDRTVRLNGLEPESPPSATTLSEFLATRIVELLVHGDDLACSAGSSTVPVPIGAASVATATLLDLCRYRCTDIVVLRSMTRTERSPADVLRCL